jgi:hypothetical protein
MSIGSAYVCMNKPSLPAVKESAAISARPASLWDLDVMVGWHYLFVAKIKDEKEDRPCDRGFISSLLS